MALIRVEVVRAFPERSDVAAVELRVGSTVRDALRAAAMPVSERVGIFGRRVELDTPLADGDRVEIYRPLAMDPGERRRQRARSRSKSRA